MLIFKRLSFNDRLSRLPNVIKIDKYSSFTNNADALVRDLVEAIYADVPTGDHVRTKTSEIEDHYKTLFDTYATVNKGLYDQIQANNAAKAIVTRLQALASDIYEVKTYSSINYYNNTAYGDLIKDYEKFSTASTFEELDMTLYNKFTSTGTVTPEEGLNQLTIDIDQTKSITKDWFIQSSQPTLDANGEINERLFTISVANSKLEVGGEDDASGTDAELIAANLEELEKLDRFEKEGRYSQDDPFKDIVYDDGSAYYIVNVLEAVKDNKVRAKGNYSYSKVRGTKFLNQVIDEISKKVAGTGSYASLSKEYWLKKMDITYHDQKVYDYFKDNYPDLFD